MSMKKDTIQTRNRKMSAKGRKNKKNTMILDENFRQFATFGTPFALGSTCMTPTSSAFSPHMSYTHPQGCITSPIIGHPGSIPPTGSYGQIPTGSNVADVAQSGGLVGVF